MCSTANGTVTLNNRTGTTADPFVHSSNIIRVSSTNNQFVFRGVSGTRGQGWITATDNGHTYTRQVWVGEPNAPATLSGPSQVLTGALVDYNSSAAPGATSYEWRLPFPFDVIPGSWNLNAARWQMRATTGRNLTAFTGTAKTGGLVQVWGKNKCGNGGAKTMNVSHSNGGGGAIPFMANIFDFGEAPKEDAIYPNPANTDFHVYLVNRDSYSSISTTLITIDGKVVFSSENRNLTNVPTSNLPNGNYILSVVTDKEHIIKNIIVQH